VEIERNILRLTDEEVCSAIEKETRKTMNFWKYDCLGWAPEEAAQKLSRSMLDWQMSLSGCLKMWIDRKTEGELILAWANLGSLVEGFLKLVLCVYYKDYLSDKHVLKRKGKIIDPDEAEFGRLRQFFRSTVWTDEEREEWDTWLEHIQQRRNNIHAYKAGDIGSLGEWNQELRIHLMLIRALDSRLPYPV
jgi:hypothetical protein